MRPHCRYISKGSALKLGHKFCNVYTATALLRQMFALRGEGAMNDFYSLCLQKVGDGNKVAVSRDQYAGIVSIGPG